MPLTILRFWPDTVKTDYYGNITINTKKVTSQKQSKMSVHLIGISTPIYQILIPYLTNKIASFWHWLRHVFDTYWAVNNNSWTGLLLARQYLNLKSTVILAKSCMRWYDCSFNTIKIECTTQSSTGHLIC